MYDEATGENWVKGTKDFSALYFNFLLLKKKVQNKKLKSNPNYMQTWLYITNISIWLWNKQTKLHEVMLARSVHPSWKEIY